ncbi:glutamate racemase [Oceanivirga miroungae]|uniref:Glutamate racemase n=1 Tax=Oceanivirga miroungae TaxID=1130046 RepID=A0A6I8M7P3_9FUSO|nr:glutamate racemase [Oceanivirga miroungae]VWL85499.1 glutamate racemase [Oceanivirga miroungae]
MAIGIFDSGIGGITVYKKIKEKYPNVQVIYFADLQNFPYGEKTEKELNEFTKNITTYLMNFDIEALIIACNTASSVSKKYLEKNFNIDIYSIIEPITNYLNANEYSNLSLIATNMTVRSNVYQEILLDKLKHVVSAPKLVNCAENLDKSNVLDVIKEYISPDMAKNTNIILACTHFPLLSEYIYKLYPDISLLDPAKYLSESLSLKNINDNKKDVFITSDKLEYFKTQLKDILKTEDLDVRIHKW